MSPHFEWIQRLRDPAAYPHTTQAVELIETHISWVFLTGEFAYKVKKPVNLGFLDFSSLALRQRYCEEELRLNRRLAPQIYLDVVPVGGSPHRPRVGCVDHVFEYAVRMRQFQQANMLEHVMHRGELSAEQITALGGDIALFHQSIERAPTESAFGTQTALRQPMLENFEQIANLTSTPQDRDLLEHVRELAQLEFTRRQADIVYRKAAGFVRECHGDMHVGNMVVLDGRIVIFDCIEFNPNLYWIDTISDIAFAVMDLEKRQHSGFGNVLLNSYLERCGDYQGLVLWRHYLAYRAMVRAKVGCIRAGQSDIDATSRLNLINEYRRYLRLAHNYLSETHPRLIITHGLSGSGKTTVTTMLMQAVGAVRLRSDVERKRLFGLRPEDRSQSAPDSGIYCPDAGERTYRELLLQTRALLTAGLTVIVDATFLQREQREPFRALAQAQHCPFFILHCEASAETLRRNIRLRQVAAHDASEADLEVLERQLVHYRPLDADEVRDTIVLQTEGKFDLATLTQQVRGR